LLDYTPYPASSPNGSYPGYASPIVVSMTGFNTVSGSTSSDPWLPAGAGVTTGNNVDAYIDVYADGSEPKLGFATGDLRATVTAPGAFDRVYDFTQGPQASDAQKMASVTDLFYVTNWMHDWWYDSGFTEAGGNAQASNLGRGGTEGDVLLAEGQAGAPGQRDNSNMEVLADGQSPRMHMYVWSGKSTSTLDVEPSGTKPTTGAASFGPTTFSVGPASMALVVDGTAPTSDACQALINDLTGKIAVLDRGTCSFKVKVVNAQTAHAVGVVLVDNVAGEAAPSLGDDPTVTTTITIPTLSVSLADGAKIKLAISSASTATMGAATENDRDGTIDNTVVSHEWGHYLHLRNVFGSNQVIGAESEGWADFNAIQLVVKEGDNLDGAFALAQYATESFPDDPAYYGIRRFPYSTDTSKNPLTFKDIADSATLPTTAPMAAGNAQAPNSEVHAAGEVWAQMMFEGFVSLLKQSQGATPRYSFVEARRRMSDYVVAGMKLAPTDPTYTEQRDAVLAAAAAADKADLALLAQAFAKRGAGTCAVSPPRSSTNFEGVVESFTVVPSLNIVSAKVDDSVKSCDHDGHLDDGETGKVTVTVYNAGVVAIPAATATATSKTTGITFPGGAQLAFGAVAAFGSATATIDIALDDSVTSFEPLDLTITSDVTSSCAGAHALSIAPYIAVDTVKAASATDTVEADSTSWTLTGGVTSGGPASDVWSITTPITPSNHAWTGIDDGEPSDTQLVSPPLVVAATGSLNLSFDHRFAFENSPDPTSGALVYYDGGVIEISSDGGKTWADLSTVGTPGYGGQIGDPTGAATNALKGRQGFVGQSTSWPATDKVSIDLGSTLAGKTIQIRFRIATDEAGGAAGWSIDNIKLTGITNTPFDALANDKGLCRTTPLPDAGVDGSTAGGADASVDGSAVGTDASVDGATDTGGTTDGATSAPPPASSGCGCTTAGSTRDGDSLAIVGAIAALAITARRRRA
ncbi:MAG: M36 family metallopeptidase, partial [Polyangiales bacterium]